MNINYISMLLIFLLNAGISSDLKADEFCAIGCKSFTQISLGLDCTGEVTSDILLSSTSNCQGPFEVEVMYENMQPIPTTPFLGAEHVGMTLIARVTDMASGNNCMVTLFIEDKVIPDLICGTTVVPCDAFDGVALPQQFTSSTGWSIDDDCQDIFIPVAGISALADINLALSFTLANTTDVEFTLTSPDGTAAILFDGNALAGCTNAVFEIQFDDEAILTNSDLTNACTVDGTEVQGSYQGMMPLAPFLDDTNWNGNWVLTVCAGTGAAVELATYDLLIGMESTIIPFPVPAGAIVSELNGNYIVTGFDACGPASLSFTDEEINETCASDYQQTILRNWVATDGSGNSASCQQTIHVERKAPTDIVMPPNYFPGQAGALACEDKEVDPGNAFTANVGWNALENGHPSPDNEYYPAPFDNVVKWYGTGNPAIGACDDLSVWYEDTRINACSTGSSDGCFTIKRRWMIFEHCTGIMSMHDQLIKVMDIIAPTASGIDDITIDASVEECLGGMYAPNPILTDNCSSSEDLSYSFSSNNGMMTYVPAIDQYFVSELPLGESIFTYTVSDCCGNTEDYTMTVTVEDNAPPTPVCQDAKVSLTIDGTGKIFPEASIDQGSHDNCASQLFYKIIRMDDLNGTQHGSFANQLSTKCDSLNGDDDGNKFGNQIYFDDFARFCCEDIPSVLVVMRVFDIDPGVGPVSPNDMSQGGYLFGHYNDCMRTVEVEDKLPPTITCPANITLECDQDYTDLALTGTAIAADNCEIPVVDTMDMVSLNPCGVGQVIRTWTATDAMGRVSSCQQVITLEDNTAPVITYPADITVDCSSLTDLDVTGRPMVDDNCDLIGFSFSDVPAPLMGDTCGYRVVRNWSGWSLCDGTQTYSGQQVIISIDTTGPTIMGMVMDLNLTCSSDVPDPAMVTATDNCSTFDENNLVLSQQIFSGDCLNSFSVVRTWLATDSCGNESSISQIINVNDDVPPTLSITPGDFTLECGEAVPALPNVTATDNCDTIDPSAIQLTDTPGTMACVDGLVRTRVWTVADACGNPATVTRRYFQIDNENPVFVNPPANVTLSCTDPLPSSDVVATDDCTAQDDLTIDLVETVTNLSCPFDYTLNRMWTVTDGCGKTAIHTQVITVSDNENPTFDDPPGDLVLACTDPIPTAVEMLPASDDCTPTADLVITYLETVSNFVCIYDQTITRTWTVTDACNKTTTHTQVITIADNANPTFDDPPADIMLACTDPIPTAVEMLPASDDCTPTADLVITYLETVSNFVCIYNQTITRTWTVTDACDKTTTHTQVITVSDNENPTFDDPPGDLVLACTDPIPTAVEMLPASDDCTPTADLVITYLETVSNFVCVFDQTITRTWTVTDACNKTTTHTQVITVADNQVPTFDDPPEDMDLDCNDAIPAVPTLTATDDCTPVNDLVITFLQTTTDSTCIYTKTLSRVWMVTDLCGKTNTHTQTITIADEEPPMFTFVPASFTVSCDEGFDLEMATATDNCELVSLTLEEITVPINCGEEMSRTWTATDRCGQVSTASQTISIIDDEAPQIDVVPEDVTVACGDIPDIPTLMAMDNCDAQNEIAVGFRQDTILTDCIDEFTLIRNWFTFDACNNKDTFSYSITVQDMEDPSFLIFPNDIALDCFEDTTPLPGTMFAGPTAVDDCDAIVTVTYSDVAGGIGNCQSITRTWTAMDNCGKSISQDQMITFTDDEAPTFTVNPGDITINCDAEIPMPNVMAFDNCELDGDIVFTQDSIPGICVNSYVLNRKWKAMDLCGNADSVDQMITIRDIEGPMVQFANPEDVIIILNCGDADPPLPELLIGDNCSPSDSIEVSFGETVITEENDQDFGMDIVCPNIRIISRAWVFFDECGNSEDLFQQVFFRDITPPMIDLDDEVFNDIACDTDITPVVGGDYAPPTATDTCTDPMIDFNDVTTMGDCANEFIITRTWTASDSCGNSSTAIQTFNFIDVEPPSVTCADTIRLAIGGGIFEPHQCDIELDIDPASFDDSCDGAVTITNSLNSDIGTMTYTFGFGETVFQFIATDACGNMSTCDMVVEITDGRIPTAETTFPQCFILGPENQLTVPVDSLISFIDCSPVTANFLSPQVGPDLVLNALDIGSSIFLTIGYTDSYGNAAAISNVFGIPVVAFGEECEMGPGEATAQGRIETSVAEEVADVQVYVEASDEMVYTDEDGVFQINDPAVGPGYAFYPSYNERIRDGLSTLDLVLISRHLIGLQPITNPHLLIAADVDYSDDISPFDLVTLQKVILWIEDEFPDGDAWRFIKDDYLFPLSGDPFSSPFPEMILIDQTMNDYMNLNFTAIKVGDVNASYSASSNVPELMERSALPTLALNMINQDFKAGDFLQVPVYAGEEALIQGFDLEIATKAFESIQIVNGQLSPATNFKKDRILIQWVSGAGQRLTTDEPLFELTMIARADGTLRTALNEASEYLTNTAFADEKASHVMMLNVNPSDDLQVNVENTYPVLYPNIPNPFRQETTLRFYVPSTGKCTLQIANLDGREVFRMEADYTKGYHEQVLRSDQLPGGGVLQCQLITEQGTVTQKMLLIRD